MTYRIITFLLVLIFCNAAYCAQFGEYKYSKYLGIQQQMAARNAQNRYLRAKYYQNPTRNIKYPTASNPYPNIQNTPSRQMSANYRYSPGYYQNNY